MVVKPCKTKVARANNKPYVNKQLRKEISIRAHLKNIANKTGDISDLLKYKKKEIMFQDSMVA